MRCVPSHMCASARNNYHPTPPPQLPSAPRPTHCIDTLVLFSCEMHRGRGTAPSINTEKWTNVKLWFLHMIWWNSAGYETFLEESPQPAVERRLKSVDVPQWCPLVPVKVSGLQRLQRKCDGHGNSRELWIQGRWMSRFWKLQFVSKDGLVEFTIICPIFPIWCFEDIQLFLDGNCILFDGHVNPKICANDSVSKHSSTCSEAEFHLMSGNDPLQFNATCGKRATSPPHVPIVPTKISLLPKSALQQSYSERMM